MDSKSFITICKSMSPDVVVQKYIIENETFFFSQIIKGKEFEFKKDIADMLKVHIRDIVIVGSGKLGFSLKPEETTGTTVLYRFKQFDHNSLKKSDLDIGIISSDLFDREMKNLYDHMTITPTWKDKKSFASYVLKGRITIRFLPEKFKLTDEIKLAIEKYEQQYGREINIEIYKSWHYFETYHRQNIQNIRLHFIATT